MSAGKLTLGLILAVTVSCTPRDAEEQPPPGSTMQDTAAPATQEWVAAPGLPPGAQMAVISGNPGEAGPFTVQLRFPNDYRVPPHTHPAAETVTVASGILHTGEGGTFDLSRNVTELRPGQSQSFAAGVQHFAHAAGETVIEVQSTGPFRLDYVNPADAPASP